MSKMFFKGRIETRQNHVKSGYNTKRDVKLGTSELPLTLIVCSDARKLEIEEQLTSQDLFANITVDEKSEENILELEAILNKPKTTTFDKTPNRNDPCICGSGKKYKKCCA